ncbi:MAG: PDZ domain-containing protein [Pirellulales bacterium]|nr:PDZ domain-containing protein [Pirellulales bacterium]
MALPNSAPYFGGVAAGVLPPARRAQMAAAVAAVVALCCGPASVAADLAQLEQSALKSAVEKVADSVVQIQTVGGLDQIENREIGQGPATGLIVTPDGYIVSSAFGFAQRPTSIIVRLPDGQQHPAELIGRDYTRMLVLLKINCDRRLPAPAAAPLSRVRVGDWAVAVGRTYSAGQASMSVGVVSALQRMHGRALQTDANVSANNYGGPLVDVNGQVLGVLAPMAPQGGAAGETDVLAGAEYYDSGIGFAIPLEDVLSVLDRWKQERDLKRGLLGVGLKSGNPHATQPIITAVWPASPAAKAGWKAGDRVVAVNGTRVDTQTQLRFQIAPHYAGDTLEMTLRRGKEEAAEEIRTSITLADKLSPFRHAFLGVLPQRGAGAALEPAAESAAKDASESDPQRNPAGDEPSDAANENDGPAPEKDDANGAPEGIAIRAVWPESPAAAAGMKAGDRISQLGGENVASISEALTQLNAKNPGETLEVTILRDGSEQRLVAQLTELPTAIPAALDLPGSSRDEGEAADGEPKLELLKIPEMPQTARYYLPPTENASLGLMIYLGSAGEDAAKSRAADWQQICRRDGLILLMPEPSDAAGWSRDDTEYLARLLQTALARFDVDPYRVVVAGEGRGGQLAYSLAFTGRRIIRGVVAVDSPLPRTFELPDNSTGERLAVLSVETPDAPLTRLIQQDLQKIAARGYPVVAITRRAGGQTGEEAQFLDAATQAKIARWIDALDRF